MIMVYLLFNIRISRATRNMKARTAEMTADNNSRGKYTVSVDKFPIDVTTKKREKETKMLQTLML